MSNNDIILDLSTFHKSILAWRNPSWQDLLQSVGHDLRNDLIGVITQANRVKLINQFGIRGLRNQHNMRRVQITCSVFTINKPSC